MKHVISLILLFCIALSVGAQTEKGNFLIGGTASFQFSQYGNLKTTSLSLSPNFSYFLVNRLALGIITPLNNTRTTASTLLTTSMTYAIGPTARYYFPISSQWSIFSGLDYFYQWSASSTNFQIPSADIHSTSSVFRLNLGLTWFVARNMGVEGILYYQNANVSYPRGDPPPGPTFGVQFGFQVYWLRNKQAPAK